MGFRVFLPVSEGGLPASEITIPQVLKKANYTSSLVHRGGGGGGQRGRGREGERGDGKEKSRVKGRRKKEGGGGEGSKDGKRRGEILTPSYFSAPHRLGSGTLVMSTASQPSEASTSSMASLTRRMRAVLPIRVTQ